MRIKSIYHNEALGVIALKAVLDTSLTVSFAKSVLILPLVFHKDTLGYIIQNQTSSIEHLVRRSRLISNFNQRYYSLLPVSINSIYLGQKLNCFKINENGVEILKYDFKDDKDIGLRASKIVQAAPLVSSILKEDASSLYQMLNIKI